MKLQSIFTAAILPLAIAGCGGSGNGGVAGIDGSGSPVSTASVSAGPITGFGSVFVNGRRFVFDGQSSVLVEDATAPNSALKVGQFVVIRSTGTDSNGHAVIGELKTEAELKGEVTAVDTTAQTLTILNRTVQVTRATTFDNAFPGSTIADVAVGDFVEVSGFQDAQGNVNATRLEKEDPASEAKLIGSVSNLSGTTFFIGSQEVDAAGATLELGGASLGNGLMVEVKGTVQGGVLVAATVKQQNSLEDDLAEFETQVGDEDREAELKGTVTGFDGTGDTQISVNGVTVQLDANTSFEDGTSADLANSRVVEVKGNLVNGVVTATKISFENEFESGSDDTGHVELAITLDQVTLLDADTNSASLVTSLGLEGVTDVDTRFEDDSSQPIALFGADDLASGMYVEVEGDLQDDGSLQITQITREDAQAETQINGMLEALDQTGSSVTLLGITVGVGGQSVVFHDAQDNVITEADFFNQVQAGSKISVTGTVNGGQLDAQEVEID